MLTAEPSVATGMPKRRDGVQPGNPGRDDMALITIPRIEFRGDSGGPPAAIAAGEGPEAFAAVGRFVAHGASTLEEANGAICSLVRREHDVVVPVVEDRGLVRWDGHLACTSELHRILSSEASMLLIAEPGCAGA